MADLRVANRRLAAADAVEEVAHVVGADVQFYLLRRERLREDLRTARLDLAAGDEDHALGPLEANAVRRVAGLRRIEHRAGGAVERRARTAVRDAVGVRVSHFILARGRVAAGD